MAQCLRHQFIQGCFLSNAHIIIVIAIVMPGLFQQCRSQKTSASAKAVIGLALWAKNNFCAKPQSRFRRRTKFTNKMKMQFLLEIPCPDYVLCTEKLHLYRRARWYCLKLRQSKVHLRCRRQLHHLLKLLQINISLALNLFMGERKAERQKTIRDMNMMLPTLTALTNTPVYLHWRYAKGDA